MPEPMVASLHEWLKSHEEELLQDYRAMLQIPSLESEPLPNAPFGKENRKALDFALALADKAGMKTVDLDGFIGYGEFGSGKELILSLGHLDVVPTGPGWKFPEFGAEIKDGYVYARGAVDDKGPTMASFYAMRALKECIPDLQVRLRQVFGCNEESGFKCVHHYMEVDEAPTFGVAPDSGWPLCNAEKGIADLMIKVAIPADQFRLVKFAGGQRPNIVIDRVQGAVEVAPEIRKQVETAAAEYWDKNVVCAWKGDLLEFTAQGKAAHGSTPFAGDSAYTRAMRFLATICPLALQEYFRDLTEMSHPSGAGIGIDGREDATGPLTANIGIVEMIDDHLHLTVNVRYPTSWTGQKLIDMATPFLKAAKPDSEVQLLSDSAGLFFPLDSPLVDAILRAYRDETSDEAEPFSMGGGTYARAVPNTVSIGTSWLGDGDAHQNDERMSIESLYKASRIYAHIFYNLAVIAGGIAGK